MTDVCPGSTDAATTFRDSAEGFKVGGWSLCLQGSSKTNAALGIVWEADLRSYISTKTSYELGWLCTPHHASKKKEKYFNVPQGTDNSLSHPQAMYFSFEPLFELECISSLV